MREADDLAVGSSDAFLRGDKDATDDVTFFQGCVIGFGLEGEGAHAVDGSDDGVTDLTRGGAIAAFVSRDVEVSDFTDTGTIDDHQARANLYHGSGVGVWVWE